MKVLQVVSHAQGGGLERVVASLADAVSARGWPSTVVHYRGDAPPGRRARYVKVPAGGAVRRWPIELLKLVRAERPGLVHLHGANVGALGAVALRLARAAPTAYTDHSTHAGLRPRLRLARRLTARLPTVTIAVSTEGMRSLIRDCRVPPERVRLIRNGTPEAPPLPSPPAGAAPLLVYVANHWPRKAHGVLLEAIERLETRTRLSLVGRGLDPVEAEARRRGLEVEVHGYLDDPWSVAEGAWAYVHPAVHEGLPLAVIEAMMRGLPVIASRIGGNPEAVEDGETGLLVPPGDARALAGALARILRDRPLRDRMGAAGRRRALERFEASASLKAYLRLYREFGGAEGDGA